MSDFLKSILPTEPVTSTIQNARCMLIYGGYKIGKSAMAAWLSMNKRALWLDYEDGGEMHDRGGYLNVIKAAEAAKMKRIDFLLKLWSELRAQQPAMYDYVIHDKLDNLEEWAERWATVYFKSTIIGKNFTGSSVLELDKGGGYLYLREKFKDLWTAAIGAAPRTIFLASMRDRQMDKNDTTTSSNDLDLTGKVRKIAVGFADIVGYLYREPDGSNWVSFCSSEKGTFAGSRIARLDGKRIKLSWQQQGKLTVDWDKLFIEPTTATAPVPAT